MLLEELLDEFGVFVIWIENGKQAVDEFKNTKDITAVLMDLKMPEMDGFEATRQIKQIIPAIPVIAQTAYAFAEDKVKALKAGCDDFITKPIGKLELVNVLRKHIK